MPQQIPQVGEDVTALMGGGPQVGEDVTALMSAAKPMASHGPESDDRSTVEKAAEWLPTAGGAIGGIAGMAGGPVVAAGLAGLGGAAGRMGQRAIEGMHKRDIPQGMDLAADAGLE